LSWIELLDKYNLDHTEGASAHTEWDNYILYKKKLPSVKVVTKNNDGEFEEEYDEEIEGNNEEVNRPLVGTNSQISNGKRKRTYAQLPDGTVLSWIELLSKYNLDHMEGASAHTEWDKYVDFKKGLPKVNIVYKDSEIEVDDEKIGNEDAEEVRITKRHREFVWKRDIGNSKIGTCYVCGYEIKDDNFETGHILAKSLGGNNNVNNLRAICIPCNRSMGTKNLEDFKKDFDSSNNKINTKPKSEIITRTDVIAVLEKYTSNSIHGKYFEKAIELLENTQ